MHEANEARRLTRKMLGLKEEDVAYITAELLEEMETHATEVGDIVVDRRGKEVTGITEGWVCRPQDWGNSLVFRRGYVLYNQGRSGPHYACGNAFRRRWNLQPGDQFNPQRRCPAGFQYYQLCRPSL